jgi:hypothetical protein
MDSRFGQEQVPTLGAYVASLQAGCACICCGAPLRGSESRVPSTAAITGGARAATVPEPLKPAVVSCPHCGCEVTEVAEEEAVAAAA